MHELPFTAYRVHKWPDATKANKQLLRPGPSTGYACCHCLLDTALLAWSYASMPSESSSTCNTKVPTQTAGRPLTTSTGL
jgi:hypothetical protein